MVAAEMEMAESKKIQEEVWKRAVAATRLPILIPPLVFTAFPR